MTRNIDELSNLQTKSEPPEQYFKKMDLDEEQVEKRIEYTEKANELFDVILVLLLTMQENGSVDYGYARGLLESWLLSLIAEFTTPDDYLIDYATDTAYNFIDASERHEGDPWYTSADRSLYNAENSANDVLNYDEYQRAIEAGKTHKKWITENDKKVRDSHRELHNKVIPIKEYFRVGVARMRFPKDYEYAGMFPEELIGCRCSIKYLPENKESDIINNNYEKRYQRAKTVRNQETLETLSQSPIVKFDTTEDIVSYFKNEHGIPVENFPEIKGVKVKAPLAGIDDMLKRFPELKRIIKKISFDETISYMGEWDTIGNIKIGKSGLSDYGTGIHEPAHALDTLRSKPGFSYSESVIKRAKKNAGLSRSRREYENLCIKMTGKAAYAKKPPELYAYAMETALGGVENKLGNEILKVTLGDK